MPVSLATLLTSRVFNGPWFRRAPVEHFALHHLAGYFHRLDAIYFWNRALGRRDLIHCPFEVPDGADSVFAAGLEGVQSHNGTPVRATLLIGLDMRVAHGGGLAYVAKDARPARALPVRSGT